MEGKVTFYDGGRQPTVMFKCAGCGVSDIRTISRMKAAMFIAELPEINCANCGPLDKVGELMGVARFPNKESSK